ncbi:protein GRINL1A isoform X2 [Eublepharis macularius]|uniref:DNA-directed RNA polymerase II subunit GRINL1A n=1 Tax=Eublepharis macularius TaxID=481883 RepID=A0AA97KM31_EUBMA|nr:protein GRINL1A isoform X2 [Eublepharis macularius]
MAEPEPLRGRSLPELREMLRRQERLLGDRKFISRLPDEGKKVSASAEKLKVAIAQEEELRRRAELLSAVRLQFQKKPEELEASQCGTAASEDILVGDDPPLIPDTAASHANKELGSAVQNKPSVGATKTRAKNKPEPAKQSHRDSYPLQEQNNVSEVLPTSRLPHHVLGFADNAAGPTDRSTKALVEALERLSIAEQEHKEESTGKGLNAECRENPFQSLQHQTPKSAHYIEVLEWRAKNPVEKKSMFKTNRTLAESSGSSNSSSKAPSPRGPLSSLSAEERRRREKQQLDDVTAARLPPLHHAPVQLLPMEASITLQVQQKAAYEEMQAKLAAQKLAQKLGIQMVSYEPEGEAAVSYQEVKDEDGYSSSED